MFVEQINAWASYDQTAKNARNFSNARLSRSNIQRRAGSCHDIGRSRHSVGLDIGRSRHSVGYDIGGSRHSVGHDIERSRHSVGHDIGRSRHSVGHDIGGSRHRRHRRHRSNGSFHSLLFELEDGRMFPSEFCETLAMEDGESVEQLEHVELTKKQENLTEEVLSDIRDSFPVFFERSSILKETDYQYCPISTVMSIAASVNATMPWVQSYVRNEIVLFFEILLRGIGQVYFQNNPVSGLLILAAMFAQSSKVAIHGVIAVVCGTYIATCLGFDKGLASSGLFGYNSFLVGLALATFDSAEPGYKVSTILATIVFSSFNSILFVMLGKLLVPHKSPPLTFPFNVSTIVFLLASANMGRVDYNSVRTPALPDYDATQLTGITAQEFFAGTIRGIGQVFLADNIASGALVLAGIAVCSRISAIAAFLGSALGAATALATGVPGSQVALGMFGFNASLSATAMLMFYTPSGGAVVLAALAASMTVLVQQALATMLEPLGLPFLTLPFCFVALPFIIIQGTTSVVIAVPLASMTIPEDHLRRVNMLADGFAFLRECLVPPERPSLSKIHSRKMTMSLRRLSSVFSEVEEKEENQLTSAGKKRGFLSFACDADKDQTSKTAAKSLFQALDEQKTGHLRLDDVTDALQAAGLNDPEGLSFAKVILDLVDLNESQTIEQPQFVAFVSVTAAVKVIRNKLVKFFDFVDIDSDGNVDFDDIDMALEYLGQGLLTKEEKIRLIELTSCKDEEDGLDLIELMDIVTVAKVKAFVNDFQHGG
jgi:urea transporter